MAEEINQLQCGSHANLKDDLLQRAVLQKLTYSTASKPRPLGRGKGTTRVNRDPVLSPSFPFQYLPIIVFGQCMHKIY